MIFNKVMCKNSFYILFFSYILISFSHADHLKGKNQKDLDKIFVGRTEGTPKDFDKVLIKPSSNPNNITKELVDNKNTKEIEKIIDKKNLLSVIYYDGQKIVVDKKSLKIKHDTKLYSFSLANGFTSYILGDAICKGHIKGLDDKISKYVPETKGTLYENTSIKDLIKIAACESEVIGKKGVSSMKWAFEVVQNKTTSKKFLESISGKSVSDKIFNFNNFLPDLVSRAIDVTSPGGLKNAYQQFANKSGTSSEMFFLIDKNGWPMTHGWLFADREDFLRLSIQIYKDWNSDSCLGKYFKDLESNKINISKNSDYSGFFYFNLKNKSRNVQMQAHGGQLIHVNLDTGAVLAYHSITKDYKNNSIWKLLD